MHWTIILAISALTVAQDSSDYTQYVNPFTGTESGGNMFPGVTRPYGIVKLGPDLYTGSDAYSGYLPTGKVFGFSMTHESGTGGAPKYGVVSQMPWLGNITNPLVDLRADRAKPDEASVGYYKTSLAGGTTVELASSERAGLYRHTFTSTDASNIVVDVSHVLASYRGQGLEQHYKGGRIEVFADGHYETSGTCDNGWNRSPNWTIYSCGRFSQVASRSAVFSGTGTTLSSYGSSPTASGTQRVGAVFTFPSRATITSRVGLSFISTSQACSNLDRETPSSTSFSSLVSSTKSVWNTQVLSTIKAPAASTEEKRLLYTALYGTFLIPTNKTSENPLWSFSSSEPYYDDTFTLWDLHRCSTALWHVLQPRFYTEYIASLISIAKRDGYLPDGRSSNFNGRTQGGSNADNVLADAYVKGLRSSIIDWNQGYEAMRKDAEVTPPETSDPQVGNDKSSTKEGRGALPDWISLGWISPKFSRAVSRAVEYAGNDFALAQVAKGLGKAADQTKYLRRSRQWRNHWNPNATSLGSTGFVVPRRADGSFVQQDPLSCGGCYWGDAYYQGLPWEYSLGAHHDVATLVQLSGGNDGFAKRLDTIFTPGSNPNGDTRFNKTIFNPGNEPDFATPYLYNFINQPHKSVQRSRFVAKSYYNTGVSGLPGNSDAGAMQTWLLWNIIGLYPLTGQTTFLIASPWYSMTLSLGGSKTLNITTQRASDAAIYVQSLKVNGKDWRKNWLSWNDVFANGGSMEFVMGTKESGWFNGPVPPSPAQGNGDGSGI